MASVLLNPPSTARDVRTVESGRSKNRKGGEARRPPRQERRDTVTESESRKSHEFGLWSIS